MTLDPSTLVLTHLAVAVLAWLLLRGRSRAALAREQSALDANAERFLQAAGARMEPIDRRLKEVDEHLAAFNMQRARRDGELTQQLSQLGSETAQLLRALRRPEGRGQWGELQLRRVVEIAGMREHCRDFRAQVTTAGDGGGRLAPDMVVDMPSGRCVVIDSKTPLDAYLDAAAAEDAGDHDAAGAHLTRHASQLWRHVEQLGRKDYSAWVGGALPDLVVLFLPAEHLFAEALQHRPTLIEDAYARGVMVATPTTLIAMLHAIARGWREERLAVNAEAIATLGRELHERICTFAAPMARLGRQLETAVGSYNAALGSLESRVLVSARRFEGLDAAAPGKHLEQPAGAAEPVRRISALELVGALELEPEPWDRAGRG